MKILDEYTIQFSGLAKGKHTFDYQLDSVFFSNFDTSEIQVCQLDVILLMTKTEHSLLLEFQFSGNVTLNCDRCLSDYIQLVEGNYTLAVHFEKERKEETADLIYLLPSDDKINIRQYLYEFSHLLLPIKRMHPDEKDCDSSVTSHISSEEPKNTSDPRWDDLKKIKFI